MGRISGYDGIDVAEFSDFYALRVDNKCIGKDQPQLRIAVKQCNLLCEPFGQNHIVAVDETNVPAFRQAHAAIAGGHYALIFLSMNLRP